MPETKPRFIQRLPEKVQKPHSLPSNQENLSGETKITDRVNPELYSSRLISYCSYNKQEIENAEKTIRADKIFNDLKATVNRCSSQDNLDDSASLKSGTSCQWQLRDTRKIYNGNLDNAKRDYFHLEETEFNSDMSQHGGHGYCYLCTTLEEHRKHMKNERKVRGSKLKPYTNPVPANTLPTRPFSCDFLKEGDIKARESNFVIYKVLVKTGNEPECSTDAQVSIRLYGASSKEKSNKIILRKPGKKFLFLRDSVCTFSIDAPNYTELSAIDVESDGREKSQCWFLESVTITNMKTSKTHFFPCNKWLSLYHVEGTLLRNIKSAERKEIIRSYEVKVITGNVKHSGTDSKVYLTLIGSNGQRSKKFLLNRETNRYFKRGASDDFSLECADIGNLKKIRIEHDDRGKSRRWLLYAVVVNDLFSNKHYVFYCNQWLVAEEGNAVWREISLSEDHAQLDNGDWSSTKGDALYEVVVHTGDRPMAGTDANVYVQILGAKENSKVINLSDIHTGKKNLFERSQVDSFQFNAKNISEIKGLKVGHDNKGMAPGWFLDKVILRKFDSVSQILPKKKKEVGRGEKKDQGEVTESSDSEKEKDETENKSERSPIRKRKEKRSVTSSAIHKVTRRQLKGESVSENESASEESLSTDDSDEEDDKKGSRKKRQKNMKDEDSDSETSEGTSVWDESDEGLLENKAVQEAIKYKMENAALERTMQKVEAIVEEYVFISQQWFDAKEGDGKTERILSVNKRNVYKRSESAED